LLRVPQLDLTGPGLVHVTGPSGAGKSTLLKALTGTLQDFQGGHFEGSIEIRDANNPQPRVGFVTQDSRDALLAHDPLTEIQLRLQALGQSYDEAKKRAAELLPTFGFESLGDRPIHRLSAGERKRLAIFASGVQQPSILLLDEPLNHLDATWRDAIVGEIHAASERALVVVATHDVEPWRDARLSVRVENGLASLGPPVARAPLPPRPAATVAAGGHLVGKSLCDVHGVLDQVNLDLGPGLHAVTGQNGSGKSTLLRILGGLDVPKSGSVRFADHDLLNERPSALARFRAYHIEEPAETFFLDRAEDELCFQPRNAGRSAAEIAPRVAESARALGIAHLLDRHPTSLSGGEQERLALACVQAADGRLLLLDEPTQGLDAAGRTRLCELLDRMRETSCVVLATHDEELIARADTVYHLKAGRLLQISRPMEVALRAS
jgi:energy-coupling factor transport system ATP-binding protein